MPLLSCLYQFKTTSIAQLISHINVKDQRTRATNNQRSPSPPRATDVLVLRHQQSQNHRGVHQDNLKLNTDELPYQCRSAFLFMDEAYAPPAEQGSRNPSMVSCEYGALTPRVIMATHPGGANQSNQTLSRSKKDNPVWAEDSNG